MTRFENVPRRLLRALYRRGVPVSVRDALRLERDLLQREALPRPIEPPQGCRVAVLAPHADDETFGCGGTLARAVDAGCEVRVVFLTDGRKGYDASRQPRSRPDAERRDFEDALVQTRQHEARCAGGHLGLGPPLFLGLTDGDAAGRPDAVALLAAALRELAPRAVFLPFPSDPHPDHHAAVDLFIRAAAGAGLAESTFCWGYEVWAPLVANSFVDITAVMPRKALAMAAHASQIGDVAYPRAIAGLNAYRALAAGISAGFAEAFYVETLARYRTLYASVWPRTRR